MVKRVVVAAGMNEDDVLALAAAVEKNSRHPLALAVTAAAKLAGQVSLAVDGDSFRQEPGSGARATVQGKAVAVGTRGFVTQGVSGAGIPTELAAATAEAGTYTGPFSAQHYTHVLIRWVASLCQSQVALVELKTGRM